MAPGTSQQGRDWLTRGPLLCPLCVFKAHTRLGGPEAILRSEDSFHDVRPSETRGRSWRLSATHDLLSVGGLGTAGTQGAFGGLRPSHRGEERCGLGVSGPPAPGSCSRVGGSHAQNDEASRVSLCHRARTGHCRRHGAASSFPSELACPAGGAPSRALRGVCGVRGVRVRCSRAGSRAVCFQSPLVSKRKTKVTEVRDEMRSGKLSVSLLTGACRVPVAFVA